MVRFGEKVHVVALNAEVDDAAVLARMNDEHRLTNRMVGRARAEPADVIHHTQRDVDGLTRPKGLARFVSLARALAWRRLAPALALLAPALLRRAAQVARSVREPEFLLDVPLPRPRHVVVVATAASFVNTNRRYFANTSQKVLASNSVRQR